LKIPLSQAGLFAAVTLAGPPDNISALGKRLCTAATPALLCGSISQ
jgi:hypothetical protein